jgi:hypothetical protein
MLVSGCVDQVADAVLEAARPMWHGFDFAAAFVLYGPRRSPFPRQKERRTVRNLWPPTIGTHVMSCLRTWLLLSAGTLFPLLAGGGALAVEQFDIISHTTSTPALDIWEIKSPNVQQASTPYGQITYREGDRIIIQAGGCVQTGGHGRTWKRYVDPGGPNSDRLYHGLVKVPGATNGLVRLAAVANKPLRIPLKADIPERLHLWLGYEDDGYSDNGYGGHDDATGNQCKGVGPAWVRVRIEHSQ